MIFARVSVKSTEIVIKDGIVRFGGRQIERMCPSFKLNSISSVLVSNSEVVKDRTLYDNKLKERKLVHCISRVCVNETKE